MDFSFREEDLPITSAEEILQQTNRTPGEYYVVYSIYSSVTPECDLPALCSSLMQFTRSLAESHIWYREEFNLHVVNITSIDTDFPSSFIQGFTFHGDSVDDEWFIVYLLYHISLQFPYLSIKISDTDGEFLLIEGANHLPDWIKPENSSNRVWIRQGLVHLLSDDALDLKKSVKIMSSELHLTFVQLDLTKCIEQRIIEFPSRSLVSQHCPQVFLPQICAEAFSLNPSLISRAAHAICSADTSTRKKMAGLSKFPLQDYVISDLKMSRLQYAELMFMSFFPPPRLKLVQKALDFSDKDTSKALDIGFRLTCGLEIAYQLSTEINKYRSTENYINSPLSLVSPEFDGLKCNDGSILDSLDKFISETEDRFYHDVVKLVDLSVRTSHPTSEKFVSVSKQTVVTGQNDDRWMFMSPEELDREMSTAAGSNEIGRSEDKDLYPRHKDIISLDNIVSSVEGFVTGVSGVDGIEDNDAESLSSSVDSDDADSEFSDDEQHVRESGNTSSEGDVILDIDKLMNILQKFSKPLKYEEREYEGKSDIKTVNSDFKEHTAGESSSCSPFLSVSGTGLHIFNNDADFAGITLTRNSNSKDIESIFSEDIDSDDNDSSDEKAFMKEYDSKIETELFNSTLKESFILESSGDGGEGSEIPRVDIKLNILTHLLESHISQSGNAGPVSNILGLLGVELPNHVSDLKGGI